MALGQYIGGQGASARKLPGSGGSAKKAAPAKTKVKAKRLSAKERAEANAAADPYGNRGPGGAKRKRVVRKRVRRKRVGSKATQSTSDLNKTAKQQAAGKSGKAGKGGPAGRTSSASYMFPMQNATANQRMMEQGLMKQQGGKPKGPQTATGQKMYTLKGLKGYLSNDYSMMKSNANDTSFTYRTAEARQLHGTIGMMLAGATKQGGKKKDSKKSSSSDSKLTPAAYGQKKGLLRQLLAMSEPNAPLPEGLPVDYKPFEGVA